MDLNPNPNPNPNPAPAPTFDTAGLSKLEGDNFKAIFPEEIRGKGYMKDVSNWEGFVKKFDGAQSLLGERALPTEQDPPEKWSSLFDKLGRPKSHRDYKFDKFEGVPPEYMEVFKDEEMLKGIHAAGLTQKQATAAFKTIFTRAHAAEEAEKKASDEAFNKHMDATFGQNRKMIVDNAKKFLTAHMDPKVVPYLENLDEKAMSVLLAATHGVVSKYAGEDTFRGKAPEAGQGAMTKDKVVGRMREIMAMKEYQDPFANKTENAKLVQEMETLREQLRKIGT